MCIQETQSQEAEVLDLSEIEIRTIGRIVKVIKFFEGKLAEYVPHFINISIALKDGGNSMLVREPPFLCGCFPLHPAGIFCLKLSSQF